MKVRQHFHSCSCYSNRRMLVPARISVDLRIKNVGLWPCFHERLTSDKRKSRENNCLSYSLKVKRVEELTSKA